MKGTNIINCHWCKDLYIIEITERSPEDLKRVAVTQIPVKDNQLTLMWKTLKE